MSCSAINHLHTLTTIVGSSLVVGAATTAAYAFTSNSANRPLLLKFSATIGPVGLALGLAGDLIADPNVSFKDLHHIVQCPLDQLAQLLNIMGEESMPARFVRIVEETHGFGCHNFIPFDDISDDGAIPKNIISNPFQGDSLLWTITPRKDLVTFIHYACQNGSNTISTLVHWGKDFIHVFPQGDPNCFPINSAVKENSLEYFSQLFRTGTTLFANFPSMQSISLVQPSSLVKAVSSVFHSIIFSTTKWL